MNTNLLKRFAQEARKKLIQQVGAKLEWVLQADTPELREKTEQLNALRKALQQSTKEQLIDTVAYTWFNRLVALRFMDVNGYQPLRMQVLSPVAAHGDAEILQMAKQGSFPAELRLNQQHLLDLLDGRVPSSNPQNEVYRALLIASCNYLHSIFPFLFERIDDYSELLLPDDLISELSIVQDFVNGMTEEDCQETEMIGWLYQFYISEKKDEVFASKGKVKKEEIPAATQLFTPRWIVEYMLQNTVGKLWLQNNPNSSLREKMPYYIETESPQGEAYLKISSPEEITLLDQACGSGHILVYGFELLYQIYEEAGYTASQIPELIIKNNLFGYEIDERAAQLASFSVLMKARSYYRRLFREAIQPNILCYQDLRLSNDEIKETFQELDMDLPDDLNDDLQFMQQATNYGSLIQPKTGAAELKRLEQVLKEKQSTATLFSKYQLSELHQAVKQLHQLSQKFCCIVQNPPYMSGGKMNSELTEFVRINYSNAKADLFSCFIDLSIDRILDKGLAGNVTMESWMFLSSFENFRKNLLDNVVIDSLSHFGWHIMRIAFGTVSFIIKKVIPTENDLGVYNYLEIEDIDRSIERPFLFPNKKRRYAIKNQKDFEKIPESPISYWVSEKIIKAFTEGVIGDNNHVKEGVGTRNDTRFIRYYWEIELVKLGRDKKWLKTDKAGGGFKWYNEYMHVLNWENEGNEIKNYRNPDGSLKSRPQNTNFFYKNAISWGKVTAGKRVFRFREQDLGFNDAAPSIFGDNLIYLLGTLNSKVSAKLIEIKGETLNLTVGTIKGIPILHENEVFIVSLVNENIEITKENWVSHELSWDFEQNELIRLNGQDIEEAIDLYKAFWTKKFIELHQNEEELNRQFIKIYDLEEDLDPNVPLEDITILRDELDQRELKELSAAYQSGWTLNNGKWELPQQAMYPDLPFDSKELVIQFVSYSVGVMMGRYSLDKPGLILANQGEALSDFIEKVDKPKEELSFVPDADNIIPVLDSEWFEDDIVGQFKAIVKAVWGETNYQRNIRFIEDVLQSDIRKYISKEFYKDHIKRYKKRPIYWMFSSPKGAFNVLIYMHRYTADTISNILNNYLREFIGKLQLHLEHLGREKNMGTAQEQARVLREIDKIEKDLLDCQQYEREILFDLATERIHIDLDDGVLVNYNKMGKAVAPVAGLNDAASKKKVRGFDWIDANEIRG